MRDGIGRRDFLARAASVALGLCWTGAPLAAEEQTNGKVLVCVFLRGGADGLSLLVPHEDPDYYRRRPRIAIPRPGAEGGCLDLGEGFGLHPALAPWLPLYRAGRLAPIHAVGYPGAGRSHFEEQDRWETAGVARPLYDGWLNRLLASREGRGPVRALGFGRTLPRILSGEAPVQIIESLGSLLLRDPRLADTLHELYPGGDGEALSRAGQEALAALEVLRAVDPEAYRPAHGATYPATRLARELRETAQLIKHDIGLEVVAAELGGWDTHQDQGGAEGALAGRCAELAGALAAFAVDLGPRLDDVCVLVVSEFGRTAAENGTRGTDHGHGNCAFVLGGSVAGGRLLGSWPGLADAQLNEGRELASTTDFRQVYAALLEEHCGADATALLDAHPLRPFSLHAWF